MNIIIRPKNLARHCFTLLAALIAGMQTAHADSVAQVQTTKYFAPETVAMVKQRVADVANGVPGATLGFKAGDTISYIVQFTPIENSCNATTSTIGAGGYITDYIPAGTQVTGAWFVQPDGSGGFYQTPPPSPALMADGWGAGGQVTYTAAWVPDAATLARCTAAGKTATNCNGSLAQAYADTGIFYTSDPRLAVFVDPSTDGRVQQWTNGYNIQPTRAGQLKPLMGGGGTACSNAATLVTTHNYWDAAMANAFGTTTLPAVAPMANNAKVQNGGAPPFNAGSAVAGPDSGYQLDYTGTVGPWRRISYPGSMVGSNAAGPALAAGANTVTAVSTSSGASFPLPTNTTAVRWAAGRLVVGTQNYVKISLLLTSAPPVNGLVNNSEVFGGDTSPEGGTGNRDSVWPYGVPSVASSVSTLFVLKEVVCVYDATNTCVPNNGANIPLVAPATTVKVRYRISYINTNNGTQHNVVVCDQLPNTATAVNFATQFTQVSANPNIGAPTSPAVAACGFGAGGTTFNYPTIPVLAGGGAGVLEYDVVLTPGTAAVVTNATKIISTEIPTGVASYVPSNITTAPTADLVISKVVSPVKANKGDTVTYTITVANTGSSAASLTTLVDALPGVTPVTAPNTLPASRFNYISTTGINIGATPISGVTSAMVVNATTNSEGITWTFPQNTTLAAGAQLTLTFTATAGATINNALVYGTAYSNTATVNCATACVAAPVAPNTATSKTTGVTAPVTLSIPNLTISKTIDCVFSGATCTPGSYVAGSGIPPNAKLRYKITYSNPEAAAQTITVTDTLPASTTAAGNLYVASGPDIRPSTPALSVNPAAAGAARGADAALTAIAASSVVTFTAANLPGGTSGTTYIDVQTNAAAGATVTNSASISSTQRTAAGGAAIPASAVSASVVTLTISKTASATTVAPGGTVNYTITVTNPSAAAVTLTSLVDTLPKPLPNLAGRTIQCGVSVATCVATVSLNGAAPATAPTLTQTAATATVGQINTWTFAAGSNVLNAGATLTLTFTATYSTTVLPGNTYTNAATINYTGGSSSTGAVAPVTVPYNTLSVSKAVTSPASASITPNTAVTYAITVTNTGTTAAPITSVVDTLPAAPAPAAAGATIAYTSTTSVLVNGVAQTGVAGAPAAGQYTNPAPAAAVAGTQQVVTWTLPAAGTTVINPGQTMVITFVVQYGAVPLGITYYNDVTVNFTGGQTASVQAQNQAPVTVPLLSKITKTIDCIYSGATCTPGSYVDGTPIPINAKLGYKIVYENLSTTASATGIVITDVLPVQTAANAISNLVINGVATATQPTNTAGQTTPVTLMNGTTFGVAADATRGVAGSATATGTITFAVQTTATAGQGVTNTATMTSTQDTTGVSSMATAQVTGANLSISKAVTSGTSSTVGRGSTASYTITVTNSGTAAATLTSVVDTLPADASGTISYATTSSIMLDTTPLTIAPTFAAAVINTPQVVTWTFPANTLLQPGKMLTLTFTALYATTVTANKTYYNNATVNYTGGSSTSSSANGQAPIYVPTNSLTMSKSIDCVFSGGTCTAGSYVAGTPIPVSSLVRYKLVYANLAATAATVFVKDTLPALTSAAGNLYVASGPDIRPSTPVLSVNAAAAGAARGPDVAPTAVAASTTVAFTSVSLPANSSGTLYMDVQMNATAGSASNCGSIGTLSTDTCATAGVASSTVTVNAVNLASLTLSKTTSTATLTPGNRTSYTITIQNTGAAATSSLKVLDFLPFDGATADITKRLNYFTTTGYTLNGTATALTPTITTNAPPLVAPYASNPNQQQVQWDFGAYSLAAGATLTITFSADTGANMTTVASYTNTVQTQYTSNGVSLVNTATSLAPIKLIPHLTVSKSIVAVCSGAGCTPTTYTPGTEIPANAKIRYQIVYSNPSATDAQTNVVLSDVLPTQTAAAPVSNVVIVSGPITAPFAATLAGLAAGGATLNFPTLASLPASGTGTITLDVQTNAAAANTVTNTAKLTNTEDSIGVSSSAAVNTNFITLSKTTSTANLSVNGTATYTITVTNSGTVPTTTLKVYDYLPFAGTTADATKRFNYATTTGYTGGLPVPTITTAIPPTIAPYNANANQQQVLWDFGAFALGAGATASITFTATVGSAMPASSYTNSVSYQYTAATSSGSMSTNGLAAITVANQPALTLFKIVDIFSDPVNGTTNPKFIPGAIALYTITAINAGGSVDNNTTVITDPIPTDTALFVNDLGAVGSGPVAFTQGTTSSTLTYTYTALNSTTNDVAFSNDNGTTWTYVPVAGTDGCDPLVTHLRLNPKGTFVGNPTAPQPGFNVKFRVCVK